jgi:hypothetical protein
MSDNIPDDMTRDEYRVAVGIPEPVSAKDQVMNNHSILPYTPEPSKVPEAKVVAATVGAGVGGALSVIIVFIVQATASIDIPAEVGIALGTVLTAGLAFVGGYFKRN